MPAAKFIGRRYGEEDKKDDTFSWLWDEWFSKNLFAPLEAIGGYADLVEDNDAYFGMCRITADGAFQYWIGMVFPETAETPDGYDSFPIPACEAVVNWVCGKEPDIYFFDCLAEMKALGYEWQEVPSGERMMAERYVCPRFTEPYENGNIILDMVFFTK